MFITALIATSIASIASAVSTAGATVAAGVAAGATATGAAAAGATAAGAATAMAAAKGMGSMALKTLAKSAAKGAARGVASGTMKELLNTGDSEDVGDHALSCIGTGIDLMNHGPVYACAKKCSEHATRRVLK